MARSHEDSSSLPTKPMLVVVFLLLLTAVIANIYLTHLFYAVRAAGSAESVASFCNVSSKVNCVTVAASPYSAFLGVPIAIYALEYFALAAGLTLLSAFSLWRVRNWDGLIFLMMVIGLPISGLMAWLSICRIDSLCLLCTVVYGVNVLLLLIIGLSRGLKLGAAIGASLSELKKQLKSGRSKLVLALIVGFGLTQLAWIPQLTPEHRKPAPSLGNEKNPWEALPRHGVTVGSDSAPVKIVVFTDFECPFCAKLHHILHGVVQSNPKAVSLTHRDFPLDQACNRKINRLFHQHACSAALHARCAAEQGKFWHFSSYLYGNQQQLAEDNLLEYAKKVGLDLNKLRSCLAGKDAKQAIVGDIEDAIGRKVNGTPSCYVNGKLIEGRKIIDPTFWQQLINEAIGR